MLLYELLTHEVILYVLLLNRINLKRTRFEQCFRDYTTLVFISTYVSLNRECNALDHELFHNVKSNLYL